MNDDWHAHTSACILSFLLSVLSLSSESLPCVGPISLDFVPTKLRIRLNQNSTYKTQHSRAYLPVDKTHIMGE